MPGNNKKPKFSASDILQIYLEKSSLIFSNKKSYFRSLFGSKYTDFNKSLLLDHFEFSDFKLSDTLNDLVVPAIKILEVNKTFTFSSYDARKNQSKNFNIYDVLMSTTAAPTYFPAYEIPGHGSFIDGGLSSNDPSKLAYSEAYRYKSIKDTDLFVLSLGTGSYIPEMYIFYIIEIIII